MSLFEVMAWSGSRCSPKGATVDVLSSVSLFAFNFEASLSRLASLILLVRRRYGGVGFYIG